jgi:flagellar biosynthesis protein FlhG
MSQIVAIASGKGGVGKTWLAVTLAHALAEGGARVLLFDGDLGLANVDIQLGLGAGPDLGRVVAGRVPLAEVVRRVEPGGFDLVPGRSGSGGLAALDPALLAELGRQLQALATGYDRVVIDLAAGLGPRLLRLVALADTPLVVTTAEPTALTDAYAFVKVAARAQAAWRPSIVVNMARDRGEGEATYRTLQTACRSFLDLEPPLAGIVRHDPKVADAIRHQAPLLTRHPGSAAAEDVRAIARRLAG